jgi:hypothetical protein
VSRPGQISWTAWDLRAFGRAAGVTALTLALAWLVTAATDEGGVSWGERAGRTLPLTPLCAAVGAWVALAPARSRGEARALAALGRSRVGVGGAAVAGAAAVALAAALLLGVVRSVDLTGFYPTATHASAWSFDAGAFVDAARGLRVTADGTPEHLSALAGAAIASGLPRFARLAAATTTALAGVALPLLLAHTVLGRAQDARLDRHDARIAAGAAAAVAASIVLFQAAAARVLPSMLAPLPALALLAFAVGRYRVAP